MADKRRKVILDVDTGSDDAVALMAAVLSPQLEVIGVTVTWGNRPVDACVRNTLQVLEYVGRGDIPVYAGCPEPMVRDLLPSRRVPNHVGVVEDGVEYTIHPRVMPIPPAAGAPQAQHAVSWLVETLTNAAEPISIVAVGPLTNLGMALRMRPGIAQAIAEISVMGGAVDWGNVTPVAEANFFHDPEAAKIVLDCGAKVTCVTLNATHSGPFSLEDAERFEALGTRAGSLTGRLIRIRAEASRRLGWSDGTLEDVHDPLAVVSLVEPDVLTDLRRQKCNIDISGGFADGMLIVDHANEQDESVNTWVSYKADAARYHGFLFDRFRTGPRL